MKVKITLTPEDAATVKRMYANGELEDIGVKNVSAVSSQLEETVKLHPLGERTSRIRSNLIRRLRQQCGKTWATIAKECLVHPGTIKRWLAAEKVASDKIILLAKALGTTADKIMLPDGEEDLATLDQPTDVTTILEAAKKAIEAKYRILLTEKPEFRPSPGS